LGQGRAESTQAQVKLS